MENKEIVWEILEKSFSLITEGTPEEILEKTTKVIFESIL